MKTKITNEKTLEGLQICYKVANILKENFPNEIMKIKEDTILAHQIKNRKCHSKSMGFDAFYDPQYKRIVIKQKVLRERITWRTKVKNQSDRVKLFGNFALIELMCHELAHHRTRGHAKGFKIKYRKFLNFMVSVIFAGDFDQH